MAFGGGVCQQYIAAVNPYRKHWQERVDRWGAAVALDFRTVGKVNEVKYIERKVREMALEGGVHRR